MKDRHQQSSYPLRLSPELRAALESAAGDAKRSLHAEIIQRLEDSLTRKHTSFVTASAPDTAPVQAPSDTIAAEAIAEMVVHKLADTSYIDYALNVIMGRRFQEATRLGDNSTPSRTPTIPGVNAPKRAPTKRARRKPE